MKINESALGAMKYHLEMKGGCSDVHEKDWLVENTKMMLLTICNQDPF